MKLERDDLNERINLLAEENKELFIKFQEASVNGMLTDDPLS